MKTFLLLAGFVAVSMAHAQDFSIVNTPVAVVDANKIAPVESAAVVDKTIVLSGAQLSLIENVRLSTRDPGIVQRIEVHEGQSVKAGDLVARLDRQMYTSELEVAEAELAIALQETKNDVDLQYAKISAAVNEKVLERSRAAVKQFAKSVSTTELEKLDLELQRSLLSRQQAERKLAINELNESLKVAQRSIAATRLDLREIRSPLDGMVVEVFRQPGEWVNGGEPIARIVNMERLRVRCLGSARELNAAELQGSLAVFTTVIDDQKVSVPATVVFVSPETDPVEQDFAIWAEVDNSERTLRPGMVGELEIEPK